MDTSKPILICGSGNSIPFLNSQFYRTGCGLSLKLEQIIKYNYSIGLNYWFQFGCETTFNCSGDFQFYEDNKEVLGKLPMIIASEDPQLKNNKISRIHDNTILLPHSAVYHGKESWEEKKGFYSRQLIGMFSLTLAISLGFTEIYLLGYDCCEVNGQTHFYQGVADINDHIDVYVEDKLKDKRYKFRGVGKTPDHTYKTSTYNHIKHINKKWYAPYHAERKMIKIYNVSINSVINTFDKISYDVFFQQIEDNNINQAEARKQIKEFILNKLEQK